jgi:hypothetical protein
VEEEPIHLTVDREQRKRKRPRTSYNLQSPLPQLPASSSWVLAPKVFTSE